VNARTFCRVKAAQRLQSCDAYGVVAWLLMQIASADAVARQFQAARICRLVQFRGALITAKFTNMPGSLLPRAPAGESFLYCTARCAAVKVLLALLRSTLTVLAPPEEVRIGSRRGISRSLSLSGSRRQLVKPQMLWAIGRSEKCDSKVLQSRIRLFDQIV
jgi:hypothetical protein